MNTIRRIVEFAKVKTFAFKCIAIGAALALVASACVIQLASTQLIGGRQTAQAATANRTLTVTLSAKRGRILDANGSKRGALYYRRQSGGCTGVRADYLQ